MVVYLCTRSFTETRSNSNFKNNFAYLVIIWESNKLVPCAFYDIQRAGVIKNNQERIKGHNIVLNHNIYSSSAPATRRFENYGGGSLLNERGNEGLSSVLRFSNQVQSTNMTRIRISCLKNVQLGNRNTIAKSLSLNRYRTRPHQKAYGFYFLRFSFNSRGNNFSYITFIIRSQKKKNCNNILFLLLFDVEKLFELFNLFCYYRLRIIRQSLIIRREKKTVNLIFIRIDIM